MVACAVPLAYIRFKDDEHSRDKDMGCHTNFSTGMNVYTPVDGLLKISRRTVGIRNTMSLPDPEDVTKGYRASYPVIAIDDPSQGLPAAMEQEMREDLREIFPQVAQRPFERTRICWQVVTSS